jgi:hypothetical protein
MQSLSEGQLRHLAVTTNRLAAMDGRALFAGMQDRRNRKAQRAGSRAQLSLQGYADSMQAVKDELARRGLA